MSRQLYSKAIRGEMHRQIAHLWMLCTCNRQNVVQKDHFSQEMKTNQTFELIVSF